MSEEAGSIFASVRLKLDTLDHDILAVTKSFEKLGDKMASGVEKPSQQIKKTIERVTDQISDMTKQLANMAKGRDISQYLDNLTNKIREMESLGGGGAMAVAFLQGQKEMAVGIQQTITALERQKSVLQMTYQSAAQNEENERLMAIVKLQNDYETELREINELYELGVISAEERDSRIKSAMMTEIQSLQSLKTEYKGLQTEQEAITKRVNDQAKAFQDLSGKSSGLAGKINSFSSKFSDLLSGGLLKAIPVVGGLVAAFEALGAAVQAGVRFVKESIAAYQGQEIAAARLGAVLKATGAEAWTSQQQLIDMANTLEDETGAASEEIQQMQAVLLGFTSITGANFERLTKNMIDMSAVMGGSLTGSANAFGLALDNPIAGIGSLTRYGFKFTEQQKEEIKALEEAGEHAKAQTKVLEAMESAFKGASTAINESVKSQNNFNNAMDAFQKAVGEQFEEKIASPFRNFFAWIIGNVGQAVQKVNDFENAMDRLKRANAGEKVYEGLDGEIQQLTDSIIRGEEELESFKSSYALALQQGSTGVDAVDLLKKIGILEKELPLMREQLELAKQLRLEEQEKTAEKTSNENAPDTNGNAGKEVSYLEKVNKLEQDYNDLVRETLDLKGKGRINEYESWQKFQSGRDTEINQLEQIISELELLKSTNKGLNEDQQTAFENANEALRRQIGQYKELRTRMANQELLELGEEEIKQQEELAIHAKYNADIDAERVQMEKDLIDLDKKYAIERLKNSDTFKAASKTAQDELVAMMEKTFDMQKEAVKPEGDSGTQEKRLEAIADLQRKYNSELAVTQMLLEQNMMTDKEAANQNQSSRESYINGLVALKDEYSGLGEAASAEMELIDTTLSPIIEDYLELDNAIKQAAGNESLDAVMIKLNKTLAEQADKYSDISDEQRQINTLDRQRAERLAEIAKIEGGDDEKRIAANMLVEQWYQTEIDNIKTIAKQKDDVTRATDQYALAIAKINDLESNGFIKSDEANRQRLQALYSEMEGLENIRLSLLAKQTTEGELTEEEQTQLASVNSLLAEQLVAYKMLDTTIKNTAGNKSLEDMIISLNDKLTEQADKYSDISDKQRQINTLERQRVAELDKLSKIEGGDSAKRAEAERLINEWYQTEIDNLKEIAKEKSVITKLEDNYAQAIQKIKDMQDAGFIDQEEADKQRLQALQSELESLEDIRAELLVKQTTEESLTQEEQQQLAAVNDLLAEQLVVYRALDMTIKNGEAKKAADEAIAGYKKQIDTINNAKDSELERLEIERIAGELELKNAENVEKYGNNLDEVIAKHNELYDAKERELKQGYAEALTKELTDYQNQLADLGKTESQLMKAEQERGEAAIRAAHAGKDEPEEIDRLVAAYNELQDTRAAAYQKQLDDEMKASTSDIISQVEHLRDTEMQAIETERARKVAALEVLRAKKETGEADAATVELINAQIDAENKLAEAKNAQLQETYDKQSAQAAEGFRQQYEDMGKSEMALMDIQYERKKAEIEASNASKEAKDAEIAALEKLTEAQKEALQAAYNKSASDAMNNLNYELDTMKSTQLELFDIERERGEKELSQTHEHATNLEDLIKKYNELQGAKRETIIEGFNQEVLATADSYQDKIDQIIMKTDQLREKERQRAVEELQNSEAYKNADKDLREQAMANLNKYYDLLEDGSASDTFAENMKKAFATLEEFINGLSALVNQLAKNDAEEKIRIVEDEAAEEMKIFEDGVYERRKIFEDDEQQRQKDFVKGLRDGQDALEEDEENFEEYYERKKKIIDKEMNDKLFAAKLIEAETEEQYEAAVEAARRSGDEVKIYETEQAAEKFRIEEEAKAALLALEEQEKLDKLALDEQEAEARRQFDEQIAAEKLALETETNRKKAEIQYKAEMVEWEFKLAAAIASAAQAIITAWTGGAFAGPVLAGIATAATALQTMAVVAAKPKMPAFATGGIVPGNSYSGDHKIARVNSGEGIFTQDQMRAMGLMVNNAADTGRTGNITVIIQLDTIEIGRQIFAAANNGQYFLKARAVR